MKKDKKIYNINNLKRFSVQYWLNSTKNIQSE